MTAQAIRHRRAAKIRQQTASWNHVGKGMRRAWAAMGPDLVTTLALGERCGMSEDWAGKELRRLEQYGLARPVGSISRPGGCRRLLWRRMEKV